MATKRELIDDPNSVLNKSADDEPVFLLVGRDATAAGLCEQWANRAAKRGARKEKVEEAHAIAKAMEQWPGRSDPT